VIRRNIIDSMQTLIGAMDRFNLTFKNPQSDAAAKWLMKVDPLAADFWTDEIVPYVLHLWTLDPNIRTIFDNRSRIQLVDSASYFFDPKNLHRINQPTYTPTPDDILRARLRTSGIVERVFDIEGNHFKFLDVGGQRNERRKWIHCFQDVTAVIFVTAIQEYDQYLYEDEKENRLQESLRVFEQTINNPFFDKSTIILFLNKMDLFADKIQKVKLNVCFPDFTGANILENAAEFIQAKFISLTSNKQRFIFAHKTCATDTQNVHKVFEGCKVTILKTSLNQIGFA